MTDLTVWQAFMGVAQHQSFSKASQTLGMPTPQISKKVAKLEEHLGVRLFQRSTRVVRLTDEGKALLPQISNLFSDLSNAESSFRENKKIAGVVRVACVPYVAQKLLLPVLKEFQTQYPDIKLDLRLNKAFVNLVEQNIDLAIRIDTPEDNDMIYKKLTPNELVLCASPDYLKKNRAPLRSPADLERHSMLFLEVHRDCKFIENGISLKRFEKQKPIECDSGSFLTQLALKGEGILVRAKGDVKEHLESGRLVQVLKRHPLESFGNIYAVIPNRRYLAPRVRAFFDFVVVQAQSW